MGRLHFGIGPSAQLSWFAEIAFFNFFRVIFSRAHSWPMMVVWQMKRLWKDVFWVVDHFMFWHFWKILKTEQVIGKKRVFAQLQISKKGHILKWCLITQNDRLDPALLLRPITKRCYWFKARYFNLYVCDAKKIDFFKRPLVANFMKQKFLIIDRKGIWVKKLGKYCHPGTTRPLLSLRIWAKTQ